jgi:hypothetical protein
MFKELMKNFFIEFPEVKCVGWTQYTPYFNDGDTCEFSVNDAYFVTDEKFTQESIEGIGSAYELEEFEHLEFYRYGRGESDNTPLKIACKEFSKLICTNDDLMLQIFGDHSSVFLLPGEIVTTEFEHD